ncbi:protein SOSEKI 5-like [Impatiens glandulifera]|uniref:protein SOSEKI 5-like n=1 Tax=Impatiens glandulifera TaxID=253017 RepID=UPI001FB0B33B|nr:protein SOSEKI 5-like [Impatiens glandulifera]
MRQYKWVEKDIISPERTKVWTTDNKSKSSEKKVAVIYYLSRNGQLEHPHFMEVPLSSSSSHGGGLYLKDVFNRLDFLRGKGMTNMYSWSSRRVYKNGFVWQDLSENDLILPTKACEYILKGSEILLNSTSLR